MKKKLLLSFLFIFAISFSQLNAQNLQFDYDAAGNCILKYKTVVLASQVKGKNSNDSTKAIPQSEIISGREVIIYPNPTKGILKIELKGLKVEKNIHYLLTDLSGKIIKQEESKEMFYLLDMTTFQTGIYLLRITVEDKWNKWKIIKE